MDENINGRIEGKVISFNISKEKKTVKIPIETCNFIEGMGIENDAHAEGGKRSVSLLAKESTYTMKDSINIELKNGIFAENITTEGIILHKLPIGTRLKIGEAILEISQIGKECHGSGCEIMKQVGKCVMPKEGVFVEVLKGGSAKIGDNIMLLG